MDRLAALRTFRRVAEAGSFSRAALDLQLSQAAVSKHIAELEAHLGIRLIQRTTRRMSVTAEGRLYLERIQQALDALDAADEIAAESSRDPRGSLRVNAPHSFGLLRVAPALPDFARRYPAVRVDLQLDDRSIDPIAAAFDVTLRIRTSLPDSTLRARRLCPIARVLCGTPECLGRRARIKSPDDLRLVDCLVHSVSAGPNVWEFQHSDTSEKKTISVVGAFTSNSSIAIRDMLLGHCGVALIPEFVVAQELRAGRLVALLPQWRPTAHILHALTPPGGNSSARVTAFIDFMAERFTNLDCR